MLDINSYIKFKKSDFSNFLAWIFNEHPGYSEENKNFLRSIIDEEDSDGSSRMSEMNAFLEDSYFVTFVKINKIQTINSDLAKIYIDAEFFRHAGYPGGETSKSMGKYKLAFDLFVFLILYSKYLSTIKE